MKKAIIVLVIGAVLSAVSIQPLYLMGQEVWLQQQVNAKYTIETVYHPVDQTTDAFHDMLYLQDGQMTPFANMSRAVVINGERVNSYDGFMNHVNDGEANQLSRTVSFYETDVTIRDTFHDVSRADVREKAQVDVMINGHNYAGSSELEIRPTYLDNNRYHGYIGMLKMTERATDEESLVIIQRLFGHPRTVAEEEYSWKAITVNANGDVETEIFTRDELDNPAYHGDMINQATVLPMSLGYRSNVLHMYPTLFYPFLYPFGTMLVGSVMVVIGMRLWKTR
ncbi:hypothetical protein ABID56_000967 [Alkalibacillus flavidus]|uniref:DUF3068 domain-containing protein n=1 Tax=Alkalibacillus flavidus TaxID=546021 RepID=A0ABV2KUS9_9BACI